MEMFFRHPTGTWQEGSATYFEFFETNWPDQGAKQVHDHTCSMFYWLLHGKPCVVATIMYKHYDLLTSDCHNTMGTDPLQVWR